ncbi:Enoyl-CoA hydratase/carnithine racemase [Roseivivax marinus]|uniref:enoyl-CoA hydratase/isomerase family protein n=1 Tax=Roseivivax marinus TaxID=1379903 RepID=UPI0008B4C4B4|nr:enoyl-CoA hydratase/isomerase family protein [Roseivivax marinus]SEL04785.1 Enoyl-CoA hydratase/carnithine racemase [Roseivivax marinus]
MSDHVSVRTEGRAGRITLTRPSALNALDHDMCLAIEQALLDWAEDPNVALVILDAEGDKAFCAGGDIAGVYREAQEGRGQSAVDFWRDEYRMNAVIAEYPKAVVSFMQGYVMGGGVGVGCHGSHRVVCDSTRIAMPECGIGLVPDVGGSLLLARVPGRLGEWLGLTGARMDAGDAIWAGFADLYVPRDAWAEAIAKLSESGQPSAITEFAAPAPKATLPDKLNDAEATCGGETLRDVVNALRTDDSAFAAETLAKVEASAPLSMGATLELLHRLKSGSADIRRALDLEFRFTSRALEHADFLEGVRALLIDKDKSPRWRHEVDGLPLTDVARMFRPLEVDEINFHDLGETA